MTKQKIFLLIPLAIIGGFLIYSWIIFLSANAIATWRHYLSALCFVVLIVLFLKNFRAAVVATAFYLLLGICNLFTLTPGIVSISFRAGFDSTEVYTPKFSLYAFWIFLVFLILNFNTLINMYLDYKQAKEQRRK